MRLILTCLPLVLGSCTSIKVENDRYGFFPKPGMSEDAQDRYYNSKYNLMDSSDGSGDPNAQLEVFKQKF